MVGGNNDLIMDFFSGAATTAQAVMELNSNDKGNRKFLLVQIPEECRENSEAYKAGYKNICEIGKERIRRAAKKIKEEHPDADFDEGFRVLKLDSSNMKDVYYRPNEIKQEQLEIFANNIKEDRSPEDLLFQVMLELGALPSSKIEVIVIGGQKVFNVANKYLMACFDENITETVIKSIAKEKPIYAVFRDNSFANDGVSSNYEQLFKTYSPNTKLKVL